jgi:hypothetical protein
MDTSLHACFFILDRYQATDSAVVADPKALLTCAAISALLSGVVRINCLAIRPTAPRVVWIGSGLSRSHATILPLTLPAFWQGRASRLRVKTTSNSSPIWSAKKDGTIFRDVQNEGDFVAIVDLKNGVRGAATYIVPTRVVEEHLLSNEAHYVFHPGRANSNARILRLFGDEKPDNRSFGYDRKFARYLEALTVAPPHDRARPPPMILVIAPFRDGSGRAVRRPVVAAG